MVKLEFYIPYRIEYLFDFFNSLGIKIDETYTKSKKEKVLETIATLLEQKIIIAGGFKNGEFIRWNESTAQIVNKIENNWKSNTEFSDFYKIVWFSYEKWYVNALEEFGLKSAKDWDIFIDQNFKDFEGWIEENKPKN